MTRPTGAPIRQEGAAPVSSIDRDDVAREQQRLRHALEAAQRQLHELARRTTDATDAEIGAIFEAQALFASDPAMVDPSLELIERELIPAAVAFRRVSEDAAATLAAIDDVYLRERAADVRDVARRVTALLEGRAPELHLDADAPCVIVADDLDASAVAGLRPQLVAAICLQGGAVTGHAAIVARAIGIPLVLDLGRALDAVAGGAVVAVDGDAGDVLVEPTAAEMEMFRAADVPFAPVAMPADPAGGAAAAVRLKANVGSEREAMQARDAGADGIGLVRTELLFLGRGDLPGFEEQRAVYRRIRAPMEDKRVTFRTLDIGGDKPGPLAHGVEPNPALGVRGLRHGLAHPEVLTIQLQAMLAAAEGGELDVMLPMVATIEELRAARRLLQAATDAEARAGRVLPASVRVGIMVEVPSAALMADSLLAEADFASLGTNDLAQYLMAADRMNAELAPLVAPLQPALLRLIAGVVEAGRRHGIPIAVCGEAAGDPLAAPLLVGLGVDELSVAPSRLPALREHLGHLSIEACRDAARAALAATSLHEVELIARRLTETTSPPE